jgi:sulfite oxidase
MNLHRRHFLTTAAASSLPWGVASRSAVGGWFGAFEEAEKPDLVFRSTSPRNAEPKLSKLIESWTTPTPQFYVRSHGANPEMPGDAVIRIDGAVERPREVSVSALTNEFTKAECVCTISCAGIRRMEHSRVKPVKGVQWAEGPIGNALWAGVKLSDVLKSCGLRPGAKHVWFEGADTVQEGSTSFSFGGSIPLSKALDDRDGSPGALLATHMNGEPLRPDHGAPLRTIVPGFIGARSVKWLTRITVSEFVSPNHFVADAYKMVPTGTQAELDEAAPIYRYPVNAAACVAEQTAGGWRIRGYALPTGHRSCRIASVELSTDSGSSWLMAQLDDVDRDYCWRLWSATLPSATPETTICVRATDSLGNTMPSDVPWNAKGYLYNAWHRTTLGEMTND